MVRHRGTRAAVLALVVAGILIPVTPSAQAEATPTIPLLTGGVLTYSGTVGGQFHDSYSDHGDDAVTDPVDFNEQALWEGGYFLPYLRLAPTSNWQSATVGGHFLALTSSPSEYTGTGTTWEDGVGTRSCTFTHHLTLPQNGSYMPVGPDGYIFMSGMASTQDPPDQSCTADTSPQLYPWGVSLEQEVSTAYFNTGLKTLPTAPWQTTSHTQPVTGPTSDLSGDTYTFTNGKAELDCAICVSDITFKQLDDPATGDQTKSVVPDSGTYDGNIVEISATVHNASPVSLTVPFTFLDRTTNKPLREAVGTSLAYYQTIAAGATTTITYEWDTQGTAWRKKQPLPTHTIAVVTGFGGAQRDITVLPKPVVLVHGWNSDASTWASMKSQLHAQDADWPIYAVGDSVAARGETMDTDPISGNTIETNASIEARYIEHVRELTGAQHVDLVVHSMGGLISRAYIDHMMTNEPHPPGGRPLVSHLVMLGTPNQGSVCAYVAAGPTAIYGTAFLKGLAIPTIQLTPAYVNGIFDKNVRNQHGVLFSVDAGTGYPVCGDGDGDGVVTRDSAWWIYSDVGTRPTTLHTSLPHDQAIATQWIPDHLEKAWFEETAAGATRRVARAAAAVPVSHQQVAVAAANVAHGHDVTVKVPVDGGSGLTIALVASPRLSVTLVKPSGRTAVIQKAGSVAATRPFRSLHVARPGAGTWKVRLHDSASSTAPVMLTASETGTPKTESLALTAKPHRVVQVRATLRHGRHAITGASVTAFVRRIGGTRVTLTLRDNGRHGDARAHDGVYTASTSSVAAGQYFVVARARTHALTRFADASTGIS